MIPYKKQFLTIEESSNMAVGILDEAFVAEHGKPGVKFIISGSSWEILKVHEDHVYVKSIDDPTGAIPSWAGEELPVPFEVAQEVGWVRGFIEDQMKSGAKPEEVAFQLSERYPLDSDAILRAISEIIEHFRKGHRVPTDKRITIEDWKDFVVIQASFGSLTNRSLAQLIGHMLSERTGYSVVVQHDPYRIFIKTAGTAEAEHVMQIVGEIGGASDQIILNKLTKATVKTGLFKRRMIHVARRFGALEIWADFSKISLQSLMKSFKGTVIYDEAIKETFTKDLDLNHTLQILNQISIGKIEIVKLEDTQFLSPIARIGAEKARMKSDLIPPERMRVILTEAAKARLLSEARTLVCTNRDCLRYVETIRTKDLPDKPVCPLCETNALGVLEEEERAVQLVLGKDPEKMTKKERDIWKEALETAKLMAEYGKVAAVALNVHRLKVKDVKKILQQESKLSSRFYELILEAERRVLRKRF
jgi:ATP-dependent Lhr-like helicase